jgi:adenosylcobinamide-phosphate synthase
MSAFLSLLQDRLFIVFCAFALNVLFWSRHRLMAVPASLHIGMRISVFLRRLEQKLNREQRTPSERLMRGLLVMLAVVVVFAAVGLALAQLVTLDEYGWLLEVAVLGSLLGLRLLYDTTAELVYKQHNMSLYESRNVLVPLSDYDHEVMDVHGVFRHCAEAAVSFFADRVVGAVFFYLLLGLPGLLLHYGLWKLHQAVDYPHPHFTDFGRMPVMMFQLLNAPVNLIASLLLAVSAIFTPASKAMQSLGTLAKVTSLPLAWVPVHIAAVAADIQLGGTKRRKEWILVFPWVGKGTPLATDVHLMCILRMLQVAALVWLAALGVGYMALDEVIAKP